MGNKIVVLGGNHHNTLGVVRSLGMKGLKPYVMVLCNTRKSFVLTSKYIQKGWICQTHRNAIDTLCANFSVITEKAVLIATNDESASLIDSHINLLSPFFYLPNAGDQGVLTEWMNKEIMSQNAASVGLNVPKTWLFKDANKPSDIEFPCITKGINSVIGSKNDIRICQNEVELNNFLYNQRHCPEIQIQKFIDKDFEFQFLGLSLNGGEEIIIPGRTRINRPNGIENDEFFLEFGKCDSSFDETISKCKSFIRLTGYSGIFSAEFLRGKDGTDYFMEVNFRNDANGIAATTSGTNLPYLWYLYNSGGDYKTELDDSSVNDVFMTPDLSYFHIMMKREISYKEWKRNIQRTSCFSTYCKDDIRPFIALLFMQKRGIISAIFKRFLKSIKQ